MSYVFVFLIAFFKDFPLFLGISNRVCSLNLNVTYAIGGNNGNDGIVSTRYSYIEPATKPMRILSKIGNTITEWLLSYDGGSSRFI